MTTMIDVCSVILRPDARHTAEIAILESMQAGEIPQHLQQGLSNYLLMGIRPGQFLVALLKNDLREAVLRYAGDLNDLHTIVLWLTNAVPAPSWGSPQLVEAWITRKQVVESWGAPTR